MDALIDQLWAWCLAGWTVLVSPGSARAHALGLIGCVLGASLYSARIGIKMARDERGATIRAWNQKKKGNGPRTWVALIRKILVVGAIYFAGLAGSFKGFLVSLTCGVLVPAVVLFVMAYAYPWFDPSSPHLIDDFAQPVTQLEPMSALLFVADQTLRGGLFDLIEIFAIEIAHITNNPDNFLFSIGLFLYHLYVEAFVFSGLVLFGYNALILGRQLIREISHHWNKFKGAKAGGGPAVAPVAVPGGAPPAETDGQTTDAAASN